MNLVFVCFCGEKEMDAFQLKLLLVAFASIPSRDMISILSKHMLNNDNKIKRMLVYI